METALHISDHLKLHLKGKIVLLGIGNTLRSDDGLGSVFASRIKNRLPWVVYDAGVSPENYLGKIIKEEPDSVIIIDAVDFGGRAGELRMLEASDVKTVNLFFTHNASLSLVVNYLQENLRKECGIIMLVIQPKSIALGEQLSPEVSCALQELEQSLYKHCLR